MFKTERDMVDMLLNSLTPNIFGVRNYGLTYADQLTEVNLGHGIADLVILQHKECSIGRNKVLEKFDIAVYMVFERNRNWLTADEICSRTKAALKNVKSSIATLLVEGFIRKRENEYKFYRKYKAVVLTSIAIEAKLTNWKRALKQAYRYNWFSHYTYVVLPKSKVHSAISNITMFQQLKVGLANIDNEGRIEVVYTPRRTKPYNKSMAFMLNENLLGKWLEKTKPSR